MSKKRLKPIPFSPPHISEDAVNAVVDVLRSGWITTGPRTREFEKALCDYTAAKSALCVSSCSGGLELILRWFGVGPGDEVILPAYTYAATANIVVHTGATPVFVDSGPDYNLSVDAVAEKITKNTKLIIPVDIGGLPCDYDRLKSVVFQNKANFKASNLKQEKLGRILILADAAHSLGANYKGKRSGTLGDVNVFSFHAVKNLTTAEGGAIMLNFDEAFNNDEICNELRILALHGQTKDALSKSMAGKWQYDILDAGYKYNMTDIQAAMGLVGLKEYDKTLAIRKEICDYYNDRLENDAFFQKPVLKNENAETSYHLYMLRINNINEVSRNKIIQKISSFGVAVNVHFRPLPLMSYYKDLGYKIENYPNALDSYSREISLPVYFDLNLHERERVADSVISAVHDHFE